MNSHLSSPLARWSLGLACGSALMLSGCAKQATPEVASVAPQGDQPASIAPADAGVKGELATYLKGRQAWVDCMDICFKLPEVTRAYPGWNPNIKAGG